MTWVVKGTANGFGAGSRAVLNRGYISELPQARTRVRWGGLSVTVATDVMKEIGLRGGSDNNAT